MENVLLVNKPLGMTPLQTIDAVRKQFPQYKNEKIGYAGRLDPMATGLLLLLVGDENKKRKTYERLEKTYTFAVLFGIETDSYDLLGKVVHVSENIGDTIRKRIVKHIDQFVGTTIQPYPPYSSPRVNGKPLFYWAREGKLQEIVVPQKEITITAFHVTDVCRITMQDVQKRIKLAISKVHGAFRQEEILKKWKSLEVLGAETFPLLTFTITCSSGTYVRSIAHQLGQRLGVGASAWSIHRTSIGIYRVENAENIVSLPTAIAF